MPRKEHRLEARTNHGSRDSIMESRLKAEDSEKSTVNRDEEGGIEVRTRITHSSRDSTTESKESRLDAKSSGKSTTVNTKNW